MIQRHKVTAHFQMIGINSDTDRDHTILIAQCSNSSKTGSNFTTNIPTYSSSSGYSTEDILKVFLQKIFSNGQNQQCRRQRTDKFDKLQSVSSNCLYWVRYSNVTPRINLSDHAILIDFNQCLQIVRMESSNVAATSHTFRRYSKILKFRQIRNTKEGRFKKKLKKTNTEIQNGLKLLGCNAETSPHTFRPCRVESDLFARFRISNSRKLDKNWTSPPKECKMKL